MVNKGDTVKVVNTDSDEKEAAMHVVIKVTKNTITLDDGKTYDKKTGKEIVKKNNYIYILTVEDMGFRNFPFSSYKKAKEVFIARCEAFLKDPSYALLDMLGENIDMENMEVREQFFRPYRESQGDSIYVSFFDIKGSGDSVNFTLLKHILD